MKGIKFVFDFNKNEGFLRDKFEKKLIGTFSEAGMMIKNLWCTLDKRVIMADFPVIYYTNECIVEFAIRSNDNFDDVIAQIKDILHKIELEKESGFSVVNMQPTPIMIMKDEEESQLKNSKVFVTGVTGQLGHDVMNCLYEAGYEAIGSGLSEIYTGIQDGSPVTQMPYISLNIMDIENVNKILTEIKPDIVIHCAAWNSVDRAEEEDRVGLVRSTNASGTRSIAEACAQIDAKMVYISTDYVFDGSGEMPWPADAENACALNVYGQTKREGELAVSETMAKFFIIRTSWAYGINGNNFVKVMLEIGKKYNMVRVVNDQIGTPTYTKDLANLIVEMIATDKFGYYNATNEGGYVSWFDFAYEIFRQAGIDTKVLPVATNEYDEKKAERPLNSRLDKSKLTANGFHQLPDWRDALGRYLEELGERGKDMG